MLPDPIGSLPGWLLAGVALGGLLALGFATVFVVGLRLFPDRNVGVEGVEGGEHRRRAEIRRYLSSIDEPFLEDHLVAGRPAAFFLPERSVAITFDAQDYFEFERAGISAVLLEYEVPGSHLGSRLPFETPDEASESRSRQGDRVGPRWGRRWQTRDSPDTSVESAFDALGLTVGATENDVRAAYRERVKDVHPDHGGDVEAFRSLQEAYTVALERAE